MLLVRLGKDVLVLEQLLNLSKQRLFFVVMVRLDESIPGETVANKVGLVLVEDNGRLMEDGVVASEDRVVQQCHVRRARGKDVGLGGN